MGGKYRNKKTVFELLDTIDKNVPECDRYDPYLAVYVFEALQVPIEEELQGRTLLFKHVPATVSICSNVPGHTDPVHIRSHGEPQQLIDEFIQKLLRIQAARGRLMSDRYQPIIDALNLKQLESKRKLGEEDREEEGQRQGVEEEEEEEVQIVGTKRKRRVSRKKQRQVSRKRRCLDDEAQLSGEDDDDDSDSDGSDVEGLIDDNSDVEENNTSFYRAIDNNVSDSQPGPSTAVQTPPLSTATLLTHEQEEVERKRLRKIKAFLSKLLTYIDQITILGFNSQKYDIPLIRSYLPSSILKHECIPKHH